MSNYKEIKSDKLIEISDKEFDNIRSLVYENIGINLTDDKRSLLKGRLQKLLRKYKLDNFSEYYAFLLEDKSGAALSELANTISTNHTYFGRESEHFQYLEQTALPNVDILLKRSNSKDLRVWCAGSSTGEEPYTIAMSMMEYFGNRYSELDAGLLATDISERALSIAKSGVYEADKLDKIPRKLINKYFKKLDSNTYEVKDFLKKEVLYKRFNLIKPKFPFKKQFHIIFCRNVMIYFDNPTRNALVERFYNLTVPGGYLFIGHSETIDRTKSKYKYLKPAVYQRLD